MISKKHFSDEIINAIRSVVGAKNIALHEPVFNGNEWLYLKECLDSTYVSSVGNFVNRFELDLANYTGSKYAVAMVNGTAALHIALMLAGVKADDEVLIPALTFVATANSVIYCNAIPHFVDSDESSLGIDAEKLRDYLVSSTEQRAGQCINSSTNRVIRVIVVMHTFGHPSCMDKLLKVASDFNITLVEDAAESLGSFYCGKHTGTFGLFGTLSFNGNKTITTGGGGALLTDNKKLAEHAKHLSTTSKLKHSWEYRHDEIGYNYRLPNLNAALGCAQLEQLPKMLSSKRKLFTNYQKAFEAVLSLKLVVEPSQCQSNYWLQTILLDTDYQDQREYLIEALNNVGLMSRPAWILINELLPFNSFPKMDLTMSKSLAHRLINIPSGSGILLPSE